MAPDVADRQPLAAPAQVALVLQLVIVAFGCVASTLLAFVVFAFGLLAGSAGGWLLSLLILLSMPTVFVALLVGNRRACCGRPNVLAIVETATAAPALLMTARAGALSPTVLAGYGYVALAVVVLYDLRGKVR